MFAISWRNPGKAQAHVEFGDYVTEGVVKAVSAIEEITGQEQINAAGYCIGGTVLASTVAYYAAKRMKKRIKSATFFTTLWISLNRAKSARTLTTQSLALSRRRTTQKVTWMVVH